MGKYSWTRWLPGKLKYRFFLSFVLLILIPFTLIQLYQFWQLEKVLGQNISSVNQAYLTQLESVFSDAKSKALMAMLMLERDRRVVAMLTDPDAIDQEARQSEMEARLNTMKNFIPTSPYIYIAMFDLNGNLYTSFETETDNLYADLKSEPGFVDLIESGDSYQWLIHDASGIAATPGARLLSLYSLSKDASGHTYGFIRISLDYQEWFYSSTRGFSNALNYFIVDRNGEIMTKTRGGSELSADTVQRLSAGAPIDYYVDKSLNAIVNVASVSSMNWYMISQFPLDKYFGDVNAIRKQIFWSFFYLTIVFVLVTFLISSSVTRPLMRLQKKMAETAKHKLVLQQLPESNYKGEILALNQSFNRMIRDITELVQRLKVEEREKEAAHFQMLLSQVDPHFLLNSLNTIKWIAFDNKDETIYHICVSLGKLLETSLTTELELIHLKDEIELVRAYVYIQNYRHAGLFDVEYAIQEGTDYALVPKLSLQPLVDNAIRHGFASRDQGGKIAIRVFVEQDNLCMEVEDNGDWPDAGKRRTDARRKGIGLSNIRQRLHFLFKEAASLERLPLAQGTCFRISLPFLESVPYEQQGGDSHVEVNHRRG